MSPKDIYKAHARLLAGTTSLVFVATVWELAGRSGMINPIFFAWPSTIIQAFYKTLENGELYRHVSSTFITLVLGFGSACSAIPLGVAMSRSRTLEYLLDPLVSILYAMPRIALMPLIILMFGIGTTSKVSLVFLGCFFPILINVLQGMKNVDHSTIDMARVFGAKGMNMALQVFIPSILPYLLAGFRIALSLGLVMAVVAEFFVGVEGVGYMIALEAGYFNTSAVLSWVLVISALAIFLTELIRYSERTFKWK